MLRSVVIIDDVDGIILEPSFVEVVVGFVVVLIDAFLIVLESNFVVVVDGLIVGFVDIGRLIVSILGILLIVFKRIVDVVGFIVAVV